MVTNWLDRAIGYVAPRAGLARVEARARAAAIGQASMIYEAATYGPRSGFQAVGGTSANSEIVRSLSRLRDLSRDLSRNNPYAANVVSAIAANTVGAGIIPAINANQRVKSRLGDLVKEHFDTPAIDYEGRNNLYGLQNLMVRTMVESGECIVVRYGPPARLGLPVPLQVRVLEPDYLDVTKHGAIENGNVCFEGIEFDSTGRRVAYWIYDEHPGGGVTWRFPTSKRVDAAEVVHVYRVDRPSQARGVPWGAPVMVTLRDLADYEGAELMRQKIAACFAVFITGDAPANLAQSVSKADHSSQGTPLEVVEPGMIKRMPGGTDVKFATPPIVQGYSDYIRAGARKVAMGYSVPYEIATGDLSQVSFISGRLGLMQFNRMIDQNRWHIVIPHACATIGRWFSDAAGVVVGAKVKINFDWTPPRREMVSPKDEVPAMTDLVRSGFSSRSEQLRTLGYDPEDVEAEIHDENARADKLELRFDSDGRFPKTTRGTETINPAPGAPDQIEPGAPPKKPAAAPAPKNPTASNGGRRGKKSAG